MSNLVTKITSAVLAGAVVLTAVSSTAGVNADYTTVEAADILAANSVIVDNSSNPAAYELGNTLKRREGVKVMVNLSDRTAPTSCDSSSFADVTTSDWVCKYTEDALAANFIAANPTFGPEDMLTKGQGLKMVMQARGIAKTEGMSPWQAGYVDAAVKAGIATNFSDYDTPVSRGVFFVWAAEAISPSEDEEELNLEDLLGLDDLTDPVEPETPTTPTTPTTPVASGDDMLMVSLNPETPSDGLAQAGAPRTALLVFDVKAGSEDVTLRQLTLNFIGLGDYNDLDEVSVYAQNGEKVAKTKNFSEIEREISFDKDVVVEAGKTMTLTVAGTINTNGSTNSTYGVKLVDIEASSAIEGEDLIGALLVPATFSNVALLKVTEDTASDTVTVGETVKLAGFTLDEKNDNEDVIIKSVTFHVNGTLDTDDLSNLVLKADGEEIASGVSVNSDEELVFGLDYTIAADDNVDFDLYGVVTASIGDTIHVEFEGADDIYAVGASSGVNVSFSTGDEPQTADIASLETIEGSEINVSFEQSDLDEAKPDAQDVLIGNLKVTALTDVYEITRTTVTVTATGLPAGKTIADVIEDMELGGSSDDNTSAENGAITATTGVYNFDDINLTANEEEVLPLTIDVVDDATFNGTTLTFQVAIVEVEDDDENIRYTSSSTPDLNDILSTTALDDQTIDIESASFTMTNTSVNERQLVLGNGIETVLYKGKISIGDADTVEIQDLDLVINTATHTVTEDLDKVIDTATLNIGGETFDADVDANSIDFSSVNAVIAAGADNVEVLVTAILKDNDTVTNGQKLGLEVLLTSADLEDSNNDALNAANITIDAATVNPVTTELLDRGTLAIKVINEEDTDDNLENTVLAGESEVTIAELEIEAEYEDMKIDELAFSVAGPTDFSNTIKDAKLVNVDTGEVITDGAVVTWDGTNTLVTFRDTFTLKDSDDLIDAELVANFYSITGEGDETSATAGDLVVTAVAPLATDVRGDNSNDDITADMTGNVAGEIVSLVPTKLTFAVVETLSGGAAKIQITADSGNNTVGTSNETPEVTLTQLNFAELSGTSDGYILYKEGDASNQTAVVTPASGIVSFSAFGTVDTVFDNEQTYVIVPVGTTDLTYTLVLSGDVATYNVDTTPATTGVITNLTNDISVGSRTY